MARKPAQHLTVAGGHAPTEETRELVADWSDIGASRQLIAQELGVDIRALDHHYRAELAGGEARGVARVAAALYEKALAGDTAAQVYFLKARGKRAGWVDRDDERPSAIVQLDLVKTITAAVTALRGGAAGDALPAVGRVIEQRSAEDGSELL